MVVTVRYMEGDGAETKVHDHLKANFNGLNGVLEVGREKENGSGLEEVVRYYLLDKVIWWEEV